MKHKTYKQPRPKIVRTANSKCAYVTNSNNLSSYPQTAINVRMWLSQFTCTCLGCRHENYHQKCKIHSKFMALIYGHAMHL